MKRDKAWAMQQGVLCHGKKKGYSRYRLNAFPLQESQQIASSAESLCKVGNDSFMQILLLLNTLNMFLLLTMASFFVVRLLYGLGNKAVG